MSAELSDIQDVAAARKSVQSEHVTERKSNKTAKRIFLAVLVGALAIVPILHLTVFDSSLNYYLHLILFMMMYSAMTSSWNILGGYTGYVSLGHNVFFGIGGYLAGMLLAVFGISVFITAPLAGVLAFVIGLIVGGITLRVRGPAFIIATIALLLLVRLVFDNWHFIGGANGLTLELLPLDVGIVKVPFYYAYLLIAALAVGLSYKVKHSKLGLGLRAISQDEIKAESAGIPTARYKIIAYALSAVFVGVCGALWGQYLTYIRPNIFFIILIAANLVLMTILGGKGTIAGPVLGAVIIILVNEFFLSQFGTNSLNIVGTGTLMMVVLLFFPEGIVGSLRKRDYFGQEWLRVALDWD